MSKVNEEKIILLTLGYIKQAELYNKFVDEYKQKYLNKFSTKVENIDKFINACYKIIIDIAIYGTNASKYKMKMEKNKILEIDMEEFYNDYKEYIEEVKQYINEFNDLQKKILEEFSNENNKEN